MLKRTFLLILISMLLLAGICVAEGEAPDKENHSTWDCPNCGKQRNWGEFCGKCGYHIGFGVPGDASDMSVLTDIASVKAGEYFSWGHYEQGWDMDDDREEIEWLMLARDDENGTALVVSRYALAAGYFNNENTSEISGSCSLFKWLNGEFFVSAFSDTEREQIIRVKDAGESRLLDDGSDPSFDFGNAGVFLLSVSEVEKYMGENAAWTKCVPTPIAVSKTYEADDTGDRREGGAYQYRGASEKLMLDGKGCCYWWLRSPGRNEARHGEYEVDVSKVCSVYLGGSIDKDGIPVVDRMCAVRPAMLLRFDNMQDSE